MKIFMYKKIRPFQWENILDFASWRNPPRYAIWQLEVGENGTPHVQGYIVLLSRTRMSTLKLRFQSNLHLEKRRGTHSQAVAYCSKEETRVSGPWTYGSDDDIPEGQGARSDLTTVKRKLDAGATMITIADEHFSDFIRYHKAFIVYKRLKSPKRDWEMEVIVLIGETGTGKTRFVADNYDDVFSVPDKKGSGTYWDDYDGQETVLVDECYGKRFSHSFLLRLLDRYAMSVPIHGGSLNFNSRRIVLTSNAHPADWYRGLYTTLGQEFQNGPMYRRMTQGNSCIIRCDKHSDGTFSKMLLNYK